LISLFFSGVSTLGVYLFTVEAMRLGRETKGEGTAKGVKGAKGVKRGLGAASARWVALVATALFAVCLFQVRVAWEIRRYSLGTTMAVFSSWLVVRALTARSARRLPRLLYGLVGVLFVYTHDSSLFTLFALVLAGGETVSGW
jgi:hypothetical protein